MLLYYSSRRSSNVLTKHAPFPYTPKEDRSLVYKRMKARFLLWAMCVRCVTCVCFIRFNCEAHACDNIALTGARGRRPLGASAVRYPGGVLGELPCPGFGPPLNVRCTGFGRPFSSYTEFSFCLRKMSTDITQEVGILRGHSHSIFIYYNKKSIVYFHILPSSWLFWLCIQCETWFDFE